MPVRIGAAFDVDELTTTDDLNSLGEEWAAFWERSSEATPFQSPEWLIPWWRHFQPGELWTLAVRRRGRLVALLPAYLRAGSDSGRRSLVLLGTGNTDHLDGLFDRGCRRQAAGAIFAYLADNRRRWDLCDFQNLRKGSPLLESSLELPDGFRSEIAVQDTCPVLVLPGRFEDLPQRAADRQWKKVSYYERRAAKEGPLHAGRADEENLEPLFEDLIRLHGERWNDRGLPGVLAGRVVQDFHREVARRMGPAGMLRLYSLHIGNRLAAVLYAMAHRRQTFYYLAGFDPQFGKLSPGLLIVGHAVREAVREQARTFDFLRGYEPYKYAWGAKDRPIFRRRIQG